MAEGIGNIDQASPRMSPLKPSTKVEGMLCFLEDIEEDKDGSVSQEKSCYKRRGKDSSQDRKNGRIGSGGQKENHSRRSAKNLQKDKKNKMDLKPWNKDEKNGKDERVEG